MSGGWDSTSVFAAARAGLECRNARDVRVRPVSLRYPAGDTGDESGLIESIAERWETGIQWVAVDGIRMFEDAERRATVRDDPRIHPFESQVRSLCAASRTQGDRVALDGAGGDHLFTVSTAAILADHLRAGRFGLLLREWNAWGRRNRWTFARSTLLPLLSPATLDWIGTVRGRPLHGFWDSAVPPWVRLTTELKQEAVGGRTREAGEGISAWETRDVLTSPLVARALAWNHAIALEEGVILRSPLFDRRVIEFAASRPLNERLGGPDSKVLLRRAMRDLLPPAVLEPRGRKTGTPVDYFRREMTTYGQSEFARYFQGPECQLAALGVVDLQALREAIDGYSKSPIHGVGALLQLTLEAERWLAVNDLEE
jgi:asparagine synthase (glutamine-hydrolysing)